MTLEPLPVVLVLLMLLVLSRCCDCDVAPAKARTVTALKSLLLMKALLEPSLCRGCDCVTVLDVVSGSDLEKGQSKSSVAKHHHFIYKFRHRMTTCG